MQQAGAKSASKLSHALILEVSAHQKGNRRAKSWYSMMPQLHMSEATPYLRANTSGAMNTGVPVRRVRCSGSAAWLQPAINHSICQRFGSRSASSVEHCCAKWQNRTAMQVFKSMQDAKKQAAVSVQVQLHRLAPPCTQLLQGWGCAPKSTALSQAPCRPAPVCSAECGEA